MGVGGVGLRPILDLPDGRLESSVPNDRIRATCVAVVDVLSGWVNEVRWATWWLNLVVTSTIKLLTLRWSLSLSWAGRRFSARKLALLPFLLQRSAFFPPITARSATSRLVSIRRPAHHVL